MIHTLAESTLLRFRSNSGRTELTDDPDGYRLHVNGGTDLLFPADVHRLLRALTEDLHTAREPAEDAYPHLFPASAEPLKCHDCDTPLLVDPIPYWTGTKRVYLGSSCWRARMFELTEAAVACYEAETLPIGGAA